MQITSALPEKLRPSIGTLGALGLRDVKMAAEPTAAYIMLGRNCRSNCSFCTQRRENSENDRLSRVIWPEYPAIDIVNALRKHRKFSRVCLQTLDYENMVQDSTGIAKSLSDIYPLSVSMVPVPEQDMKELRDAGVEYLSIALDAASPEIFESVKGKGAGNRFTWEAHWKALESSVRIFGKGNTHIIVGLGESDEALIRTMLKLKGIGVYTALFAYTPVNGGNPPPVERYRAIQLAHALIYRYRTSKFSFENGKLTGLSADNEILREAASRAFMTSGCPGCNRPFYNERPGTELYNYPQRPSNTVIENGIKMIEDYL